VRDERLADFPRALVIVSDADMRRERLRGAAGITHDFMMLNPLSGTHAPRAAVAQVAAVLREALRSARRPTDTAARGRGSKARRQRRKG